VPIDAVADSYPVLLVHGFASSFDHNWRQSGWVDILADVPRRVIPVDLLGHGTAPRPLDPADYHGVGARVLAALDDEGPVDAVGFSTGARILLELACSFPQRFHRLALLGIGDDIFEDRDPTATISALQEDDNSGDQEDIRGAVFRRLARAAGNDATSLVAFLGRPRTPIDEGMLAAVACPVLVVLGDRDHVGGASRIVNALPNAQHLVARHVDHFGTTSSIEVIDVVLTFLESQ
jgi:pimeloyl-ACP methyl ester carboxylesterase